jgi:lipid A 3-O-deacylase
MHAKVTVLLSAILIAGAPLSALAQGTGFPADNVAIAPSIAPDQAPPPDPYGTFTFSVENDLFGGGTDRYYTNGFQFAWRSPSADLPRPLAWINDRLEWVLGPGTLRWGASFGQSIYTPEDTYRRNPDPTDRPYAGYLHGAVSLSRTTELTSRVLEMQLGVVGPSALGEFVQNNYHDIFNIKNTEGWDYQLKDEPAATLLYEQKRRVPLGSLAGIDAEVIPSATLSLGNVQTRHGFEWYLFAGLEGRAIARDIFLDGNTWRDSRSVDKRPFVADFQVGAAIVWRGVRFALSQVWRSEEFYGQDGRQKFGSLSVSFRF